MASKETKWTVDLSTPSGDKSVPRTSVRPGLLSELTGHDGSLHGGVRPHPGFRKVRELNFQSYTDPTSDSIYALAESGHNHQSEVTDFFPITFMRGTDSTCYGYVYRVKRSSSSSVGSSIALTLIATSSQTAAVHTISLASGTYPTDVASSTVTVHDALGASAQFIYSTDGSTSTGTVNGKGQVVVQVNGVTTQAGVATQLASAINGASGIAVTSSANSNTVTITQDVQGPCDPPTTTSSIKYTIATSTIGTEGSYVGKTIILRDTDGRVVTFTGTNAVASATKVGEKFYQFSTRGTSQTPTAMATAIESAVDLADTNGDLDMEATASSGVLTLTQDDVGPNGNTEVTGTLRTAGGFFSNSAFFFSGGSTGDLADVFIEYYDTKQGAWYSPDSPHAPSGSATKNNYTANLLMYSCSPTEPMQVKTLGRLVFVFVRGRSPALFYLDPENAPTSDDWRSGTAFGVSEDGSTGFPGPGVRPTFRDLDGGVQLGTLSLPLESSNQGGKAQIVLTAQSAEDQAFFDFAQPTLQSLSAASPTITRVADRQNASTTLPNYGTLNYGSSGTPLASGERLYMAVQFRVTASDRGLDKSNANEIDKAILPYAEVNFSEGSGNTGTTYKWTGIPTAYNFGELRPASGGGYCVSNSPTTAATYDFIQLFECPSYTDLISSAFGGTGSAPASNLYVNISLFDGDGVAMTGQDTASIHARLIKAANTKETQATTIEGGGAVRYNFNDVSPSASAQLVGLSKTLGWRDRFGVNRTGQSAAKDPKTFSFGGSLVTFGSYVSKIDTGVVTATAYPDVIDTVDYGVDDGSGNGQAERIDTEQGETDSFVFPGYTANTRTTIEQNVSSNDKTIVSIFGNAITTQQFEGQEEKIQYGTSFNTTKRVFTAPSADVNTDGNDDHEFLSKVGSLAFEVSSVREAYVPGQSSYSGSNTLVKNFLGSDAEGSAPVDPGYSITAASPAVDASSVERTADLVWNGEQANSSPLQVEFDVFWRDTSSLDPNLYKVNGARISEKTFSIKDLYEPDNQMPSGREFEWAVTAYVTVNGTEYFKSSPKFLFTTEDIYKSSKLGRGNYAFAFQLFDSKTGRMSSLSEIARADKDNFKYKVYGRDSVSGREYLPDDPIQFEITRHTVVPRGKKNYAAVEIVYDSNKYDHCFFYRSPKTEESGAKFAGSTLFLDKMAKLVDYHTNDNESGSGSIVDSQTSGASKYSRAVFYYTLTEDQLFYRPFYVGATRFDEKMPFSGAAEFLDNVLIQSNIETTETIGSQDEPYGTDPYRGGGETKFSETNKYAPELHPPANQYTPSDPSNRIKMLKRVGPNVIGLSDDRIYHMRREGTIVVRELHDGLVGVVGPHAADVAASQLFVVSSKGVKIVGTNGSLDNMSSMDVLIKETFKNNLSNMKICFDPYESVLYVYNPDLGHSAAAWFETSCMTELKDLPFTDVKVGDFPLTESFTSGAGYTPDFSGDRVRRAQWLQNHPTPSSNGDTSWKPKVYVANHERDRLIVDHSGSDLAANYSQVSSNRRTLLDVVGETHYVTTAPNTNSNGVMCNATHPNVAGDADSLAARNSMIGAYLYNLSDTDSSKIGNRAQIRAVTHTGSGVLFTLTDAFGAPGFCSSGATVAVSPVFMEINAHQLGVKVTTTGGSSEVENVHNLKQVDDIKCSFLEVSGRKATDATTKFQAILFAGNGADPDHKAVPTKPDGTSVSSIVDGSSTYPAAFGGSDTFSGVQGPLGFTLTPGIRIFCPDVDFRILSFRCSGSTLDTESGEAYSQS